LTACVRSFSICRDTSASTAIALESPPGSVQNPVSGDTIPPRLPAYCGMTALVVYHGLKATGQYKGLIMFIQADWPQANHSLIRNTNDVKEHTLSIHNAVRRFHKNRVIYSPRYRLRPVLPVYPTAERRFSERPCESRAG